MKANLKEVDEQKNINKYRVTAYIILNNIISKTEENKCKYVVL